MKRLVGTLGVLAFFAIGAVGAIRVWNMAGSTYDAMTFPAHVMAGLSPHLKSGDAYRITLDFLSHAAPSGDASPATPAKLDSIWAVTADQAAALDGCIPTGKGNSIVWVTRGEGPYLNVGAHAWSSPDGPGAAACRGGSGTAGTIVIDDATGQILGVFPFSSAAGPHPSPQITLAPVVATPTPAPSPSATPSGSPGGSAKPGPSSSPKPTPSASPKPSG